MSVTTSSARWEPTGLSPRWRATGHKGYSGDGGPATNAELTIPAAWRWTPPATCSLRIRLTTSSARWEPTGLSPPWRATGHGGYSGDGGPATNAELDDPSGVAVDAAGNLFIADQGNNRIRKVEANGIITTVAGNGTGRLLRRWRCGNQRCIDLSLGVAVDASGNLFIADEDNNRIREVGTNGIITTVAGNGRSGYSGDGGAATNAELSIPPAWQRTPPATCSLRISVTTASARWSSQAQRFS